MPQAVQSNQAWFTARERFSSEDGESWRKFIEWSGLAQLSELISLDLSLCPPVNREFRSEYWGKIVEEDFLLGYFLDCDFLEKEISKSSNLNLLQVVRNPDSTLVQSPDTRFLGYDLLELQSQVSALSNCGGFPDVFANSELSEFGLIRDFDRAYEIQVNLRKAHPEEPHANCDVWAIFLKERR